MGRIKRANTIDQQHSIFDQSIFEKERFRSTEIYHIRKTNKSKYSPPTRKYHKNQQNSPSQYLNQFRLSPPYTQDLSFNKKLSINSTFNSSPSPISKCFSNKHPSPSQSLKLKQTANKFFIHKRCKQIIKGCFSQKRSLKSTKNNFFSEEKEQNQINWDEMLAKQFIQESKIDAKKCRQTMNLFYKSIYRAESALITKSQETQMNPPTVNQKIHHNFKSMIKKTRVTTDYLEEQPGLQKYRRPLKRPELYDLNKSDVYYHLRSTNQVINVQRPKIIDYVPPSQTENIWQKIPDDELKKKIYKKYFRNNLARKHIIKYGIKF